MENRAYEWYSYGRRRNYDASPDGSRFLFLKSSQPETTHLNVIVAWFDELKSRTIAAK